MVDSIQVVLDWLFLFLRVALVYFVLRRYRLENRFLVGPNRLQQADERVIIAAHAGCQEVIAHQPEIWKLFIRATFMFFVRLRHIIIRHFAIEA